MKLYSVIVTAEMEMFVMADDADQARKTARTHIRDEVANYSSSELWEADHPKPVKWLLPDDVLDSTPWGGECDKSIREILAETKP